MSDALDFAFDDRPAPGAVREVVPGIRWLSHPLPFALDHVNCWLLGEGAERVVIDTGIADEATRARWQAVFDRDGVPGRLLVTHHHPDHIGLAGWFAGQGVRLVGGRREIELARDLWAMELDAYAATLADWYRRHGLAERHVATAARLGHGYRRLVASPPGDWDLVDPGETLTLAGQGYTVRVGGGHSPAMLLLHDADADVLIVADQVLPSISPNVSLLPRLGVDDPLANFLASLDRLRALPAETLVLPSHGRPYRGLHQRIDALQRHHEARLADLVEALDESRTAVELFPVLFARELDDQQVGFALGETLAHLVHLEARRAVTRDEIDGRTRFIRV